MISNSPAMRATFPLAQSPRLISRAAPEWGLALLAVLTGLALATTGDQRIGIYLLWVPGVSLHALAWGWAVCFLALGFGRAATMILCRALGHDAEGACALCPLQGHCRVLPWRRSVALAAIPVWAALAASLAVGDQFALTACLVGAFALGELAVFSVLSGKASPWINSSR